MTATHTPGPWKANKYGNSFVITAKDGAYDIAVIRNIGNENNEANARLIAGSPTMLATLQDMDGWLANTGHAEDHPWRVSVRAAILAASPLPS